MWAGFQNVCKISNQLLTHKKVISSAIIYICVYVLHNLCHLSLGNVIINLEWLQCRIWRLPLTKHLFSRAPRLYSIILLCLLVSLCSSVCFHFLLYFVDVGASYLFSQRGYSMLSCVHYQYFYFNNNYFINYVMTILTRNYVSIYNLATKVLNDEDTPTFYKLFMIIY